MRPTLSSLAALVAGLSDACGGNAAAAAKAREAVSHTRGPTPSRRSRPSKGRMKKFCAAAYGQPAPWLPNVKGMRYTKAGQVPR